MVIKHKALIEMHKEKVHRVLNELESAASNCSRETPRAVERALTALREAANDNILYVEEENSYKIIVSNGIKQFEEKCGCTVAME